MKNLVGYQWLSKKYNVSPVQSFEFKSISDQAGKNRSDTLSWHITFALKHEGIHLEFLNRLFKVIEETELADWINSEPSGQYARRAGFLYEWFADKSLACPSVKVGNYIDMIDSESYFTSDSPSNNSRWRVRDNLPGTRDYCPTVFRTRAVRAAEAYDCGKEIKALEMEFGEDLLRRSSVWLSIKESMASFAIEREDKFIDRAKRFAAAMERYCGFYSDPLNNEAITELQKEILGPQALHYGIRKSPIFVGESGSDYTPRVYYIAPDWRSTESMLAGLSAFSERTKYQSAVVRAAIMSFGFVYIHPMTDGNGRLSRFLVNDMLRRDGAIPDPFILPVSAAIMSSPKNRKTYDQIMDVFSKPFMLHYRDHYEFGEDKIAIDGVHYNIDFDAYEDANSAWRYPDFTKHVEYLADILELTINSEMRNEAGYLRNLNNARCGIKEFIEGPNKDIDRIIRSIIDNNYKISNKLKKEFELLLTPDIANSVIEVVLCAYAVKIDDDAGQLPQP
ncbi:MAG: Fic family protein [Methylococcaceae bacterium]